MKKVISIVLIMLLVFSLAACGRPEVREDVPNPDAAEVASPEAAEPEDAPPEEPEPEAAEPEEAEPEAVDTDSEYGKSSADATGYVDFETLKSCFDWLRDAIGSEGGFQRPTYEEISEHLGGVDGMKDHADSWRDDHHVYRWKTEDTHDFLLISFKVNEDGSETWNSSSWSSGLND